MSIRAVLFDIGNTLVEYPIKMRWPGLLQDALARVTACLEDAGEGVPDDSTIHARAEQENHEAAGYRVRPLAGRLARIYGLPENHALMAELVRLFCQPLLATGRLYDDALPVLETLRAAGLLLGAVSNLPWGCPAALWRQELARFGLDRYLPVVVYCADTGWRKPAPQPFVRAVQELGVETQDCVFVGDDPRWDLAGPRALGMQAVIIDRGVLQGQLDAVVIRSLEELPRLLLPISW